MRQAGELAAVFTGGAMALNVWLLAVTCAQRSGRTIAVARFAILIGDCLLVPFVALTPVGASVRALAVTSFALATLAVSLKVADRRAGVDPAWWSSFETAFWRYLERGAIGDESL